MDIKRTEHYIEIIGEDDNGKFTIRIQKNSSQLQIETGNSEAFIDINYYELKTIHDAIAEVLQITEEKLFP